MREILLAIFLIILLFIFIKKVHTSINDDRIKVKASDGKMYLVRNTKKKQESAEALARLTKKVVSFINRLSFEADNDHQAMAKRLFNRFRPETISEGRIDKRYTSYTVDKGQEMVLCLRTRDGNDDIYDDNMIFYVVLHELGHISSVSEDHSPEFHRNFNYILKKASDWGMFKKIVERFNYCGIDVDGM